MDILNSVTTFINLIKDKIETFLLPAPQSSDFGTVRAPIVVISGPSGVGKTAIIERLADELEFAQPISVTTRPPRDNEKNGRDYYFVSGATFRELKRQGALVEWKMKYGSVSYGTLASELQKPIMLGQTIIINNDEHGAHKIKALLPQAIAILIIPGSPSQLEERLRERGTEDALSLQKRISDNAEQLRKSLRHDSPYEYIVDNGGDIETAVRSVLNIVRAEQLKYPDSKVIHRLLDGLPKPGRSR